MNRCFTRSLSSAFIARATASVPEATAQSPDGRWLSQSFSRVEKCSKSSRTSQQKWEAADLLKVLTSDWRQFIAGSEGFLTGQGRRGLYKHGVVWGDQDMMGHVNNVTYARYAESARVNWVSNYANNIDPENRDAWDELCSGRGTGVILRSLSIDYKFPMKYPDAVTVFHKLHSLPEAKHDSIFLDVIMLSERHRRTVARCREDIVLYDYRENKKVPLDTLPFMLETFRDTFERQQQALAQNRERAAEISERIASLEADVLRKK